MGVPCPKSSRTDVKNVSLACEERFCQTDRRAQFRGILAGSGSREILVGTAKTKGTKLMGLTAQSGGMGACRIRKNTSARLLSFETLMVQILVATNASRSLLVARRQNREAVELFGLGHEIE